MNIFDAHEKMQEAENENQKKSFSTSKNDSELLEAIKSLNKRIGELEKRLKEPETEPETELETEPETDPEAEPETEPEAEPEAEPKS